MSEQTVVLNSYEFFMVKLLVVRGSKRGTRYLAELYAAVLKAARIGLRGASGLWTFGSPYRTPGPEPVGWRSSYRDGWMIFFVLHCTEKSKDFVFSLEGQFIGIL